MHVRVTHYKMKPESIAAATALLEQIKGQIMGLQGLKQFNQCGWIGLRDRGQ